MLKSIFSFVAILLLAAIVLGCSDSGPIPPRVLVFSKTKGWKHTSIPFGIAAIQKLGNDHGFGVDTTKDAAVFTDAQLRKYRAVIFNSTTGNVLDAEQQAAFERYIQAGGGFVGIHSAADTEYEWAWYEKLVGAHFSSHPHNPNVRTAIVEVTDTTHLGGATAGRIERTDEWYNYKSFFSGIHVLASLDENSYDGGTNGANHPIEWYHDFDGGRAFYTGFGHTDSAYSEPVFLTHLFGGIRYAMGDGHLNYKKAYAAVQPDENRFVKTVFVNGLKSPMELAVSDDGRIFYTELRTANLQMYDTRSGKNSLVHQFNVCTKGGTGLIGVTLDPNFSSDHFIYLYYSPPTEAEPIIFNLSRFVVTPANTLDISSEKILLQVPVQINSGSHHGGSLAWDKDGNLYLSTGDSTTPFPSNGYAPIDERPQPEFYSQDAQRSAGNTNDLKGKVLRIHPEPDGTYSIPKGNLFPDKSDSTRQEIYVMGCRNPYRIAVNPKTSVLYWGEIGPDAGKDSVQGPRGYDEFNQAKKSGNYGWPYFVGNNQAYAKWNFATQTAGARFDPQTPVNRSPNNTGLKKLPPATPAMIWYPYAASTEFPELGIGGRSAMAGAFYEYDASPDGPGKFPKYYDGALFVFDWMRNWVIAIRFDENENYVKSEPFMAANGDFRRPIDMMFGKDGIMYMLEYGSIYGADNVDARLVKVEYNAGNRLPVAKAGILDSAASAQVDKKVFLTSERNVPPLHEIRGKLPLRVLFSSRGTTDPDDDEMTYQWLFDGKTVGSAERNPVYTFTTPGAYAVLLKVADKEGKIGTDTVHVYAGNQPPAVQILTDRNHSFFWRNEKFKYSISVTDAEDPKLEATNIGVRFGYSPDPGASVPRPDAGDGEVQPVGKMLLKASDCKACHTIDKVSVGPSYVAVANRYKGETGVVNVLAKKIIAGGGGSWGKEHVMSAHPQISMADASEIVEYILTLGDGVREFGNVGTSGVLGLTLDKDDEPLGLYTLEASYTDEGANGVPPATSREVITLRNARVPVVYADAHVGFPRWGKSLSQGNHKSFVLLKNIDLTGIRKITYTYTAKDKDGHIELRLDSQAGPVIMNTPFQKTGNWGTSAEVSGVLPAIPPGLHHLYFVVVRPEKPNNDLINLKTIEFSE